MHKSVRLFFTLFLVLFCLLPTQAEADDLALLFRHLKDARTTMQRLFIEGPIEARLFDEYLKKVGEFLPRAQALREDVHIDNLNLLLSYLPIPLEGHGFLEDTRVRIGHTTQTHFTETLYQAKSVHTHWQEIILRQYVEIFLTHRNTSELIQLYELISQINTQNGRKLQQELHQQLQSALGKMQARFLEPLPDAVVLEKLAQLKPLAPSRVLEAKAQTISHTQLESIFPQYRSMSLRQVLRLAIPNSFSADDDDFFTSDANFRAVLAWVQYYANSLTHSQMMELKNTVSRESGTHHRKINYLATCIQERHDTGVAALLYAYLWSRAQSVSLEELNELGDFHSTVYVPYANLHRKAYSPSTLLTHAGSLIVPNRDAGRAFADFRMVINAIPKLDRNAAARSSLPFKRQFKIEPFTGHILPIEMTKEHQRGLEKHFPFQPPATNTGSPSCAAQTAENS